ncbi:MAG TPA: hypothetical protein VK841_17655 [Polyangiaceae bacterium]|nr:hypothetical protein [Polyangiaceae bacterium]
MRQFERGLAGILAAIGFASFVATAACGNSPSGDGDGPPSGDMPDATENDGGGPANVADANTAPGDMDATLQAGDASVDGAAFAQDGEEAPVDAGSAMVDTACTPATGCPPTAGCGHYTDPCSGQVFACGKACTSGNVCVTNPADQNTQTCQPKVCTGRCGVIGVDGCGVGVSCGGCSAGMACIGNACVPAGAHDAGQCSPLTCAPDGQNHLCGTITDGCGDTLSCSCAAGQICSGGTCMDKPPECTGDAGAFCGSVANACGSGTIACGTCPSGTHCGTGNVCQSCSAPTCGAATCGTVSNACGQIATCGASCPNNEICEDGGCCEPSTCAELADAGVALGCEAVALGCGTMKACAPCGSGQVCSNNTCVTCTPKTCADFGDAGCGHSDGCGKTLDCCTGGATCQSSICCPPGQVDYNGSCCQPACDPSQPSGPQESCGQVIVCAG